MLRKITGDENYVTTLGLPGAGFSETQSFYNKLQNSYASAKAFPRGFSKSGITKRQTYLPG